MSEMTFWHRMRPTTRDEDMNDALQAPIRDPMWMLSRQWQVGEFEGEDAGSPVRADLDIERDHLDRIDYRGGSGEPPVNYDGRPLEAVVEREAVTTDDDGPPLQTRVDAGQQFLRTLAGQRYGEYTVDDFDATYHLDPPDEGLEDADRRYVEFVDDRALDGAEIAGAIKSAADNLNDVVDNGAAVSTSVGRSLPTPAGGAADSTYAECAGDFYQWYVSLYDEPTEASGSAWDPARLAYRFAVSTGVGETETVFEVDDYRGGSLDWASFSVADADETLGAVAPDADGSLSVAELNNFSATTLDSKSTVPTKVTFPGMPAPRWWEFEEGDVDIASMTPDGTSLPRLLLTEFATQYGNDWFQIPVETPVGSLSRITDLTVTDSFGVTESAEPAMDPDWQLFMHDLPSHDEPGLFVPPTLSDSVTSDPVEKVTFARDEMANLAFAIEETVESPTGRSIDRTAFEVPRLEIDRVVTDGDPDAEFLTLANPGEDELDVGGFVIRSATDGSTTDVHSFDSAATLGPGETLRVYSGTASDDDAVSAGFSASVWTSADAVHVTDAAGDLTAKRLLARPNDALADYRLSTDIPNYWFPFTPEQGLEFMLERALLLDADTLGLPLDQLPMPRGEILDPDESLLGGDTYRIYDEEVTRNGTVVTRHYQFARWTDGTGHLWSTRKRRVGETQLSSGLRFDVLDERQG